MVVGSFKAAVSRAAEFPVWQRSYWDRIVRSDKELDQIRNYIDENPTRWAGDPDLHQCNPSQRFLK
jgi:REP element-mobilizing transposase RayT